MKTTFLLPALFMLITFISCKSDNDIPVTRVPDHLRAMVPYQNGQTIKYSLEGAAPLVAQVAVTTEVNSISPCQGCEATQKIEVLRFDFTINGRPFINGSVDNRPVVFLSIFSPQDNFQTGGGFDFLTPESGSQFLCNGPRQTCLPSIVLAGRTFTNVLEISNGNDPDKLTRAYYTLDKGLVGFAYGDGTAFSRVE